MNGSNVWDRIGHPRVLVVGDLLIDRYLWGQAERISPEAPVLVLREEEQDVRPGGAANVASFLRGLEAEVQLIGIVGDDSEGRTLRRMLVDLKVDDTGVLTVTDRPTTSKQRFMGKSAQRQPQQLLRVDREIRTPISLEQESRLIASICDAVPPCDVVIISDYAKGTCTPTLLGATIETAKQAGIAVLVDPCRGVDYARYCGATVLIPNRLATEMWFGETLRESDTILTAARRLKRELQLAAAVVTLDRDGMAFVTGDKDEIVPCRPRAVCDVTGAGDMVISVLALSMAARLPLKEGLLLANAAAGLEVERFGVEALTRSEIADELVEHQGSIQKIVSLDALIAEVERARRQGRSIVLTNGCFDLLHVGHLACLEAAARAGDVLVVAVNSDASVRRLKGSARPVIQESERAALLAGLECVDYVLVFDEPTPHELLRRLRPDVLVKGQTTADVVGRELVESYGGQVRVAGFVDGVSTTRLLARAVEQSSREFVPPRHAERLALVHSGEPLRNGVVSEMCAVDENAGN